MKKSFLFFIVLITGCFLAGYKVDPAKAKALIESLEQKIASGDYAGTAQYYGDVMNRSETTEQRVEKFKSLHDVLGDYQSMECISVKDTTDANDIPCLYLVYRIKHTKLTSIESFMVEVEEGQYKVEMHNINKG